MLGLGPSIIVYVSDRNHDNLIIRSLETFFKVARNSFVGRAQTGFQFTRETQKRNKQNWRRVLVWI